MAYTRGGGNNPSSLPPIVRPTSEIASKDIGEIIIKSFETVTESLKDPDVPVNSKQIEDAIVKGINRSDLAKNGKSNGNNSSEMTGAPNAPLTFAEKLQQAQYEDYLKRREEREKKDKERHNAELKDKVDQAFSKINEWSANPLRGFSNFIDKSIKGLFTELQKTPKDVGEDIKKGLKPIADVGKVTASTITKTASAVGKVATSPIVVAKAVNDLISKTEAVEDQIITEGEVINGKADGADYSIRDDVADKSDKENPTVSTEERDEKDNTVRIDGFEEFAQKFDENTQRQTQTEEKEEKDIDLDNLINNRAEAKEADVEGVNNERVAEFEYAYDTEQPKRAEVVTEKKEKPFAQPLATDMDLLLQENGAEEREEEAEEEKDEQKQDEKDEKLQASLDDTNKQTKSIGVILLGLAAGGAIIATAIPLIVGGISDFITTSDIRAQSISAKLEALFTGPNSLKVMLMSSIKEGVSDLRDKIFERARWPSSPLFGKSSGKPMFDNKSPSFSHDEYVQKNKIEDTGYKKGKDVKPLLEYVNNLDTDSKEYSNLISLLEKQEDWDALRQIRKAKQQEFVQDLTKEKVIASIKKSGSEFDADYAIKQNIITEKDKAEIKNDIKSWAPVTTMEYNANVKNDIIEAFKQLGINFTNNLIGPGHSTSALTR